MTVYHKIIVHQFYFTVMCYVVRRAMYVLRYIDNFMAMLKLACTPHHTHGMKNIISINEYKEQGRNSNVGG